MTNGDADRVTSGYKRLLFDADERFTHIGSGSFGGKAQGLAAFESVLREGFPHDAFPGIDVSIPSLSVLRTSVFDAFIDSNGIDLATLTGTDDAIAQIFLRGDLPTEILGDLHALVSLVRTPLAIRSSSALEDSMEEPYAGIYATKMIPNNDPDPGVRFQRLAEAIKLVYASTMFRGARNYRRSVGRPDHQEHMAVILQEVVGNQYGDRFYPNISGVARSYNFYSFPPARPEDGLVQLALGLGKTIVDGGICWSYSPEHPAHPPPFGSPREWLSGTQTSFWAVTMSSAGTYNPAAEAEFLTLGDLRSAEYDGTLPLLCSTYDQASDRIRPGLGHDGPRLVTFAPILSGAGPRLNDLISAIVKLCEEKFGTPVEIEFALTLNPMRFGCLQVRPMNLSRDTVTVSLSDLTDDRIIVSSDRVLGNGRNDELTDIVYVDPGLFDRAQTREIAAEVGEMNRHLLDEGRPYLLIGFGRWGSSDPWLGIPVEWGEVAGARSIVEATLEKKMNVELSQGSHFFHNLTSLRVTYFMVRHDAEPGINWQWLAAQRVVRSSSRLRHIRLDHPLSIMVDGTHGRGYIRESGR